MRFDSAPLDLGADQARDLAQRELLDPIYAQASPPWWQQAAEWVIGRISDLIGRIVGGVADGGWVVILVALIAFAVVMVLRQTGVVRRSHRVDTPLFVGRVRTAAEYRAASARAAANGDYHGAVLNRFRAVVRTLEQRGVIDERPGRTADEVAAETGLLRRELATGLRDGASTFDEVAYGGRPGGRESYDALVQLDEAVLR